LTCEIYTLYNPTIISCDIPDVLRLHVSTDGASANKQGTAQYWPLQIRIANLKNRKPLVVGV